jgi:ABC-type glutathione transport system ATPase component
MRDELLRARELSIGKPGRPLVTLDLAIRAGERIGLVGASGSGKSLSARGLLGLLPAGLGRLGGELQFSGRSLRTEADYLGVRGAGIGYVFQDAAQSLHPLRRIGAQFAECLAVHAPGTGDAERRGRISAALASVGLEDGERILGSYPHQLSGGQRQRCLLALTVLPRPQLLIADEPTSALDPVLSGMVCELLVRLCRDSGMALLLISHDLARVASCCERIHVLDGGNIVESAGTAQLMALPSSPAARTLVQALRPPPRSLAGSAAGSPVLGCRDLVLSHQRGWSWRAAPRAIDGVSLNLPAGRRLGVVGRSGSGKSTLARGLLRLLPVRGGTLKWFGERIEHLSESRLRRLRPRLQMVFQDPFRSLDPLQPVEAMLREALAAGASTPTAAAIDELLLAVGLDPAWRQRYPSQFSGGQCQRLAIARALATDPALLVCDEATSALDLVTQAQVLSLLDRLARERGMALVFIAHDLLAVEWLCDELLVLDGGRAVEQGPAQSALAAPTSEALAQLLAARPACGS